MRKTEQIPPILDERILTAFRADNGFDLRSQLVMSCYVGSETHGTRDPDKAGIDDVDIFAVVVPPLDRMLGLNAWEHWNFMQDELDVVVFSVRKWVNLLLKNNPNMLGTLWLRDDHYHVRTAEFDRVLAQRDTFSSMEAYESFAGYAYAQLQRLHRNEFKGYMGEKRKELVKQFGFDPKMASHLIRLYRMGIEFVETGKLNVYRPDAAELVAIKKGQWSLDQVKDEAAKLEDRMKAAAATSPLPAHPNFEAAVKLVVDCHWRWLARERSLTSTSDRVIFDSMYMT